MSHLGTDKTAHRIPLPSGGEIVLSWAARSDVGHRRASNEDSVVVASPMFAVADGMGGHAAGDRASAAAVEHLRPRKGITFLDIETLESSLAAAANDIDILAEGIPVGVGTTVTGAALMLIDDLPVFAVFNIGDSRVYSIANNELVRVTTDHSVVQELVDAGIIDASEAESHPESNVITRALGFRDDPRPDVVMVPARAGLPVSEYAPNAVKKAVIGVGHGEKKQIHMMVKVLLPKATFEGDDAADGLAIAICHAHHRGSIGMRLAALAG